MLDRLRQSRTNFVVIALYALAMVTLGFAHRPTAFPGPLGLDLAVYALPDGSLPPICNNDYGRGAPTIHADRCDACALTASPGLPPTPPTCLPTRVAVWLVRPAVQVAQFAPTPLHAPASRGPPLS